jgi:hypothetical protein
MLLCDEASDALGLFGSLSRPVFSRFSSVSYMLCLGLAGVLIVLLGQTYASAFCGHTRAKVQ